MRESIATLIARATAALGSSPADRWWVPGRLELIGKHTDYAGGRSLTAAVERGFGFVATPIEGSACTIVDAERGETLRVPLDGPSPSDPAWARYASAAIQRTAADARDAGAAPRAVAIAFASDLPSAAGLSSSTALITGLVSCVAAACDLQASDWGRATLADPLVFGAYLGAVERGDERHEGVGTEGGCQDSTAILAATANTITAFRYHPTRVEARVAWPAHWRLAIGVSGVVAEKTGAARDRYNHASRLATRAAQRRGLARLGDAPAPGDSADESEIGRRMRHFFRESELHAPAALDALRAGDTRALGAVARASTADAAALLGNQTPETLALTATAGETGAFAACPFGAGFGGSAWAAVDAVTDSGFLQRWADAYRDRVPACAARSDFFWTRLGPPVTRLDAKALR